MVKTVHILVISACCMLAASVVVAAVALVFHPTKSNTAVLLAELRPKVQCALCHAGMEKDAMKCEKCPRSQTTDVADVECELTEGRKKHIDDIVESALNDGTDKAQLQTLKRAVATDRMLEKIENKTINEKIQYLSLNVPRPSAHWYIDRQEPYLTKAQKNQYAITRWVWKTGDEIAHSRNGIENLNGGMLIKNRGWYLVYFQMDFVTKEPHDDPLRFKAEIEITKAKKDSQINNKENRNVLSVSDDNVECKNTHHSKPHTCVVLKKSGIFKLLESDLLTVKVLFPSGASLDTTMSRSYFGAQYVRNLPSPS